MLLDLQSPVQNRCRYIPILVLYPAALCIFWIFLTFLISAGCLFLRQLNWSPSFYLTDSCGGYLLFVANKINQGLSLRNLADHYGLLSCSDDLFFFFVFRFSWQPECKCHNWKMWGTNKQCLARIKMWKIHFYRWWLFNLFYYSLVWFNFLFVLVLVYYLFYFVYFPLGSQYTCFSYARYPNQNISFYGIDFRTFGWNHIKNQNLFFFLHICC